MNEEAPPFGALLKDYRLAVGLTQEALAERAGLSARAISDLERGVNRAPRQDTLDMLAQALALPPRKRARLIAAARPLTGFAEPLGTATHPPHNLPVPPTSLIGRETDVTRAAMLLARPGVRLLTLTGPSGVGKTRLGLQVAEDMLDHFEDGVWFVALATISDAALVAPTIAQTLGLRDSSGQAPQDVLKSALRQQQALLVLDNFEQILGAAPFIADLLSFCPRLKALITSRASLHVRGEHELAVVPLEQEAAITLFLQRAQAVQPDLECTLETIQAARAICQRLDGLPLAIELAAAHIKALPPAALRERLISRLALLKGGPRDLPERQQTMRSAVAWSYDLLTGDEQRLFRRLAVFVGGCTLEAAEAICAEEGESAHAILEELEALVDKSLLRTEAQAAGIPRFTMLEIIREYALERLHASGEAETLFKRHLTYYSDQAQATARIGPGQDERDERLAREQANVRAALAWARAHQESTLGLQLLVACARVWYIRGMARELGGWFEVFQALDSTAGPHAAPIGLRADTLYAISRVALVQGHYERVEQLARESLALAERINDQARIGNALWTLGSLAQARGDIPEAARCFERGLACSREAGDVGGISQTLVCLAHIARVQGDFPHAADLLEEGLARARAINTTWGIANFLASLALLAHDQGNYPRALALHRESLGMYHTLDNQTHIALAFEGMATALCALNDFERAAQLCAAAEQFRQKMGTPRPPAEQKLYDQAVTAAQEALGSARFEQAWAAGQALSLEEAIAFARADGAQV